MKKSLVSVTLLLAACGVDPDDTASLPCETQGDVTGSQVWTAAPDGACMQAASKNVPGQFFGARFLPGGGGARFIVTADGADTTMHAALNGDDPTEAIAGTLSPDGTRVVSAGDDGQNGVDARVSAVDGSGEVVLTELDFADRVDGILWAPGSDKIMINLENTSTSTGDGPMLFDAQLGTIRSYVGQFYEGYAAWSPDGTRLVIDGSTSDVTGLWILPSDGGDATRLTTGNETSAQWIDDDHLLAVRATTASFEGPYEIVKVDARGGAVTPVATLADVGIAVLRDVAPDGKTAAVWRSRTETTEAGLYFLDLDTGSVTSIGDAGLSGWSGGFSPDNAYFAASAAPPGVAARLYRVARDGSEITPLTSGDNASFVGWSDDGARLMWVGPPLDSPQ